MPRDEQFGAIREFQCEGLIRHVGLSQVTIELIGAAQQFFRVATVQNLFNLVDRSSEAVLDHCAANGIGFIPFYPELSDEEFRALDARGKKVAEWQKATPG